MRRLCLVFLGLGLAAMLVYVKPVYCNGCIDDWTPGQRPSHGGCQAGPIDPGIPYYNGGTLWRWHNPAVFNKPAEGTAATLLLREIHHIPLYDPTIRGKIATAGVAFDDHYVWAWIGPPKHRTSAIRFADDNQLDPLRARAPTLVRPINFTSGPKGGPMRRRSSRCRTIRL